MRQLGLALTRGSSAHVPNVLRPHRIRRPRAVLGAVAASALAVTGIVATAAGSDRVARSAAVTIRGAGSPTAIPGSYIVVLAGQRSQAADPGHQRRASPRSYDVKVRDQYDASIKGFSASMTRGPGQEAGR